MKDTTDSLLAIVTNESDCHDLFSKAKAYWLFGNWEGLASLSNEISTDHEDRATLCLLIASAYSQLGNYNESEHFFTKSLNFEVDSSFATKVILAGTYNTLGRIYALNKEPETAMHYFKKAVDIGINHSELVAQSRAVKEMANLGLLPEAAQIVDIEIKNQDQINNISSVRDPKLEILKYEIELLKHELSISQKKMQLYRTEEHSRQKDGFSTIDNLDELKHFSTSQLGQDLWVLEKTKFKKNGYFVEFGATDGVLLSNTYVLEKQFNWNGICAEPNPQFFKELSKNRSCNVSDDCISGISGELIDFICADEYGSISTFADSDSHSEKRQAFKDAHQTIKLKTITLNELLLKFNAPKKIDYLSIDTEGSELEILQAFPFADWDIQLITVEHNFTVNRDKIFSLLSAQGYTRVEAEFDDWYYKG